LRYGQQAKRRGGGEAIVHDIPSKVSGRVINAIS